MTQFLEVMEKEDNIQVLIPVKNIMSISVCSDGLAFIETGLDNKGFSTGIFTTETYADIKKKLAKLILFS